ncbi:hypothetical protein ACFP3U_17750 [Kitasatospora misakiensis]|uniref:Chaplin domain-containing protein n=1 Tax=Kitasatospora misakiensis TaxID=67330 RepID=A0ABW0X2Q8_9ACTN
MTFAKSVARAVGSVLLLAAPLLALPLAAAQPAAAEGPHNEQEAAVCRQVLGSFLGFAGSAASAVCAVQPEGGASTTG